MAVFRTFLFTPGNHGRRVEKALASDVDAVILDLEDAVAISEKPAARQQVVDALQGSRKPGRGPRGYVRINALTTDFAFEDLHAVVVAGVDGIVLPKLESVEGLHIANWIMTQFERERRLDNGSIDLMPLIETGAGFARLDLLSKAASSLSRVNRFAFGAGDFTLDMSLVWSVDELELLPFRSQIVLASRSAGLEPPIDTVWIRLDDGGGLARSAERGAALGFQGKLCIHPAQCPVVNDAFSPSAEAVARAQAVVDAFQQAEAQGVASIRLDGQLIDYPVVYRAQRILDVANRISSRRAV